MRAFLWLCKALTLCFFSIQLAFAASNTPLGLWQTVDDKTGKPRSHVRITENSGEYSVTIVRGLLGTDTEDSVCDKCTDERKDQPLIGMTIASGLKKNGDQYDGGEILDPDNGKIYKCKLKLSEIGDELEVRGYIGVSLFGRSQIWKRVE